MKIVNYTEVYINRISEYTDKEVKYYQESNIYTLIIDSKVVFVKRSRNAFEQGLFDIVSALTIINRK